FGPPESSNPVGELVTLRQTGTIKIYQRQFQEKLTRPNELIPEQLHMEIFMGGLDDSIKLDAQLLKPPDLSIATSIARDLEQKQQLQRVSNTRKAAWQQSRTSHDNTVNSAKSNTGLIGSSTSTNIQTSNQTLFFKRLTRVEMAEKRAKRLCYNCDEQYSVTHQCKRLLWLELDDSVDDAIPEVPDDCPKISLHAITGQRHAQTMQLPALINRHHMLSLIDSGSTHNFISSTATSRLLLDVFFLHNIRISIAKEEKVQCLV
uniref:Retrotransposon protein, unclassified n=1 Tax=Solanum tuberosum TaxID=4113 RepID=M1DKS7_SOLTU